MPWKLEDSQPIVAKIVAEISQSTKRGGKQKLLKKWRKELEFKPPHLKAFQIDEIVREVQRRLKNTPEDRRKMGETRRALAAARLFESPYFWTAEQDALVRTLTPKEAAKATGRSYGAVIRRRQKLGVTYSQKAKPKPGPPKLLRHKTGILQRRKWTAEEDQIIRSNTANVAAKMLGTGWRTVVLRQRVLGVESQAIENWYKQ